jgi:hypothetical protein
VSVPTDPSESPVPTWVATAIVVGVAVVGAVSVQRWADRSWAAMRKDIDPLAPAAAKLQLSRDTFRRRIHGLGDVTQVIGDLIRMAPTSR